MSAEKSSIPFAVIALMIASFGIGTAEFIIMGLLPEVAEGMNVSLTSAGMLITGYALGVVFGGPLFTAAATRVSRKAMLVILLVLFVVGNVLCAVAPTYWILMLGRVMASICHGAFLGIGSVVAADMVSNDKRSRAISLVFTGLTLATVLGAPLGTWIGQSVEWRAPFWVIAAIGAISLVGVVAMVPSQEDDRRVRTLRREISVFSRGQLWLALAIAGLSIGSLFAAFSYVAPLITEVSGLSSGLMTPLLMLFGLGLVAGNLIGGHYADRAQVATLLTAQAALFLTLVTFAFMAGSPAMAFILLPLIGGTGFATVPGFMTRVIDRAKEAPTLAAAVASAAANAGIALGSYLAGIVVDAGLGFTAPLLVGAAMAAVAFAVTLASSVLERRLAFG